eukprot:497283_1
MYTFILAFLNCLSISAVTTAEFDIASTSSLEAGCSIAPLDHDIFLISHASVAAERAAQLSVYDNQQSIPDKLPNVILNEGHIQGFRIRHPVPCSLHNNTYILYTYSIDNIIYFHHVSINRSESSYPNVGKVSYPFENTTITDVTCTANGIDDTDSSFIIVWSAIISNNDSLSLYAALVTLNKHQTELSIEMSDIIRVDENINQGNQHNARIVKSKISNNLLIVWQEWIAPHWVIYGKMYASYSELLNGDGIQKKFEIVNATSMFTGWSGYLEIYQLVPLSIGGYVLLYDNRWYDNDEFYFSILHNYNGHDVYNKSFMMRTPFDTNSKFPFITYAQMVEMELFRSKEYNLFGTFIKFIYCKYVEGSGRTDVRFYQIDYFFHLDFINNIFLHKKQYYGVHNILKSVYDIGSILDHYHCEYCQRKLCIHLNTSGDTYQYLLAGYNYRMFGGGNLNGHTGVFNDYYNCLPDFTVNQYLCIYSDESDFIYNDTYIRQGCYNKFPYYVGYNYINFIFFEQETNQYIISNMFDSSNESNAISCNVTNIEGFSNILQCNENWYLYVEDNAAFNDSFITIIDEHCPSFVLPTTTGAITSGTTKSTSTPLTSAIQDSKDNLPAENGESPKTTVIVIIVVVLFVILIIAVLIGYIVVKKIKLQRENKTNKQCEENAEQQSLKPNNGVHTARNQSENIQMIVKSTDIDHEET